MSNLPPVQISIVAGGVNEVLNAFKSIENAAIKAQERINSVSKGGLSSQVKTEKDKTSAVIKGIKDRESAQEAAYRKLTRDIERWGREEISAERKKNRELETEVKRSARERTNTIKSFASNVASTLKGVTDTAIRFAGSVLAIGGGFTIADALSSEIKANAVAKQIELNSQGQVSKRDILSASNRLTSKGITKSDALEGIDQFLAKTGDSKMALKIQDDLADLANASGANLSDLNKIAGDAYFNMTKEEKQNPNALGDIMRKIVAQGREGRVDIRDIQSYGTRITSPSAQFKGGITANAGFMGAIMQTSTGIDGAEATESVKKLAIDAKVHRSKMKAAGVDVLDKDGNLKSAREVFTQVMLASKGDLEKILKMGIGREGLRLFEGTGAKFQEAYNEAKKGGATDQEASQKALDKLNDILGVFENAELTKAQAAKESAERIQEVDKQLTILMENLKTQVGSKLLPELIKLVPKIAEMTPVFLKLLDALLGVANWMQANPFKAIVLALGAQFGPAILSAVAPLLISMGPLGLAVGAVTLALGALIIAIADWQYNIESKGKTKAQKEIEKLDKKEAEAKAIVDDPKSTVPQKQAAIESIAAIIKERNKLEDNANKALNEKGMIGGDMGGTGDKALNVLNLVERSVVNTVSDLVGSKNNVVQQYLDGIHGQLNANIEERARAEETIKQLRVQYEKSTNDAASNLSEAAENLKKATESKPNTSGQPISDGKN